MARFGSAEAAALGLVLAEAADRRSRLLSVHRLLLRIALSAGNIFAWVIVFRVLLLVSESIPSAVVGVTVLYALAQGICVFLTPLAGRALRHGVRRALVYGALAAALSFVPLAALFTVEALPNNIILTLVSTFAIMQGLYRALYFVPYRTEQAGQRSPFVFAREAALALLPAAVGYLLTSEGIAFLIFAGIASLIAVSIVPLLFIRETHEPYSWTYGETLRELIDSRNRSAIILFVLDGVQGGVLLFFWPLAAFIVLGQSFQGLGAVLTAALLIAFLGRTLMRRITDRARLDRRPSVLAIIVFSSWMLRLGAATPVHILLADVYFNSATAPRRLSVDPYAYEQAADGSHYVDEYTAVKEMALSIGRILVSILVVALALLGMWAAGFVVAIVAAAFAAAGSVIISHRLRKTAF